MYGGRLLLAVVWLADLSIGDLALKEKFHFQQENSEVIFVENSNEGDRQRGRFVDDLTESMRGTKSIEVIRLLDPTDLTFRDPTVGFQELVEKLPKGVVTSSEDKEFLSSLLESEQTYIFGSKPGLQVAMPFFPVYALVFRAAVPRAVFFITAKSDQTGRGRLVARERSRSSELPVILHPAAFDQIRTKLDMILASGRGG